MSGRDFREKLERAREEAKQRLNGAGDSAKDVLGNARDAARERLSGSGDATRDGLGRAADAAKENLGRAGDVAKENLGRAGDVAKDGLRNVKADAKVKAADAAEQLWTSTEAQRQAVEDAGTALSRMQPSEHVDMAVAATGAVLDKFGPAILVRVPIKYGIRKAAEKGITKVSGQKHKTKGMARTSYAYQKSFRQHYAEVRAERAAGGGEGPSLA